MQVIIVMYVSFSLLNVHLKTYFYKQFCNPISGSNYETRKQLA